MAEVTAATTPEAKQAARDKAGAAKAKFDDIGKDIALEEQRRSVDTDVRPGAQRLNQPPLTRPDP